MTKEETALKYYYREYKNRAQRKQFIWELTYETFSYLVKQPCYYCQAMPTIRYNKRLLGILVNSIDRLDSSLGYTKDNVCSCCVRCNMEKGVFSDRTYKELLKERRKKGIGQYTNSQKRAAVICLLKDPKEVNKSSYELALQCNVSHTFVDNIRKKLGESFSPLSRIVYRKNSMYNMTLSSKIE